MIFESEQCSNKILYLLGLYVNFKVVVTVQSAFFNRVGELAFPKLAILAIINRETTALNWKYYSLLRREVFRVVHLEL